jgi:hypothetical protein
VLKHEHFEELCAAASIGQATGEELLELEQHIAECGACRETYFDYLQVAAKEFVAAKQDPTLSPHEAQECLNSELFTRRFFDRAEREGIVFSPEVDQNIKLAPPIPFAFSWQPSWQTPRMAMAVALLLFLVVAMSYSHWKASFFSRIRTVMKTQNSTVPTIEPPVMASDLRIAELSAANVKLHRQLDRLSDELRNANDRLVASDTDLKATSQDRRKLASDRDSLEIRLEQVQRELAQSEAVAENAVKEANAQRQHAGDIEAKLVADQVNLHEIEQGLKEKSAALDQEHQLLSIGHDVTDLMGARNLHIVDVVDTDPRGKKRPVFGRIFFTEGKSLIFYAYDLNEAKMQKANYQYQVWAKKEGQNRQAQRLGIFYSDDKAQRRWVFKCDDAKILREIDSVFVTFGRPDSDPSHPEGSSLMYAYLRGQPNHP